MKHFTADGRTLLVLVECLLAREAQCCFTVALGDSVGWTNKANTDYTQWLSCYKYQEFINLESTDHTVMAVDKEGFDTCLVSGKKLTASLTMVPFTYSGDRYVTCGTPSHCVQGQKVYIQVSNADGTINTAASASNPGTSAASQMPKFSCTLQTVIVMVATYSLLVTAATT